MDDTLGARLKAYRRQYGLSLRDVAATVDVSQAQLSRIERGFDNPGHATMQKIEALIGTAPPPASKPDWYAISIHLDGECAKLAAALYALNEDHAALKAEAAGLRAKVERLQKIADHHYFNCEGTSNDE